MTSFSRRLLLKVMAFGSALLGWRRLAAWAQEGTPKDKVDGWHKTHNRVWLGESFWANPMEDWRVKDGAAECLSTGGNRSVHLITHQLTKPDAAFNISVRITQVEVGKQDGGAGLRVGCKSELNEYRSNCFANSGINAGLIDGKLTLGKKTQRLDKQAGAKDVMLTLAGQPAGEQVQLTLIAASPTGEKLGALDVTVPAESVLGNVAVVNNFNRGLKNGQGARYRFRDWSVSGDAFTVTPERKFGPILWSMYTLSDSRKEEGFVLKLSALTGPLGKGDNQTVELHVQQDGGWKSLGTAQLDTDAWVANFRIANWNEKQSAPFKLIYREKHTDGSETESEWTGTVRANPTQPLRLGALTCQNDYGFPYEPVVENLIKLDPDMLYFSGDQIYESHGGFGVIRAPAEPAILNYLRKFYQFGWAFRDALRNAPVVCIPDDHDVFQGNIWGEGGAKMDSKGGTSSKGGYIQPARMVNAVHRTCVSHHPDFFDPKTCKQDISVYYGDMVYGGVSFAILGDRQWKSGPEHVSTGKGRADHVEDRDFDTSTLDKPGLVLLGERQEAFLKQWAQDWRGHSMKVLLSQTVFAGVATHHGGFGGYLKADLDSGGWPQTARNNAINILRPAKALHINGDQHLTTLSQYGVEKQRDSNWSFCTPAIAAGYPRWWRPDELKMPHENRPRHDLPNTGEFLDGLGNKVYVYAVGNPVVGKARNRYERAHQKGSGFGLVTIDTQKKTYYIESFKFMIDATDGKASNQFPGWPVTLQQAENEGKNVIG